MPGGVLERLRKLRERRANPDGKPRSAQREPKRQRNLFEAAADYVVGCVEDDEERIDDAVSSVQPEALTFGINELACRAVIALARERDQSPETVARDLLGLPPA